MSDHHGHNHGNGGGHDHCDHDHSACGSEVIGENYSLYNHIYRERLVCYNEYEKDSVKSIFKPFGKKEDKIYFVESCADEQLIILIPFTGSVKLKSFIIIGGPEGSSPKTLSMFTNREDITFDNVDSIRPVQQWQLANFDSKGEIEYRTQLTKFTNLNNITIYISDNYGSEKTKIYYIGLNGEFRLESRVPVVTSYEVVPNPSEKVIMDSLKQMGSIQ